MHTPFFSPNTQRAYQRLMHRLHGWYTPLNPWQKAPLQALAFIAAALTTLFAGWLLTELRGPLITIAMLLGLL